MTWFLSIPNSRSLKIYSRIRAALRTGYDRYLSRRSEFRAFRRNYAVIVAFHRVNDDLVDGLTCSKDKFKQLCEFFQANFDVVPLEDIVESLVQGKSIAGKLAITFDDGYQDNFLNAAPILRKLKLPASFFVTTGFIGNEAIAWWDEKASPAPCWMSWSEVQQLADDGFDIGAHTVSHADLGQLDLEDVASEVAILKQVIEDHLQREVTLFAYPYGGRNNITDAARSSVIHANFSCCLSCFGGAVSSDSNVFDLHRVAISEGYSNPYQFVVDIVRDDLTTTKCMEKVLNPDNLPSTL